MSILRRVLRHVEFHPLGLQRWPYAARLLGNDFLRWFVSTKYSRGEHYWILPKMRHRGRKGGFRDWTHRYMSLECQSSAALRSLYLSRPCSKASSFFGVLSGNKDNRATETRGEVSRGKSHLFFRLRPLATSRPVLRSSAAWRLKSRTNCWVHGPRLTHRLSFIGKCHGWACVLKHGSISNVRSDFISHLCSGFHLLRY